MLFQTNNGLIPTRYLVAIFMFLAMALNYVIKVMVSVAITAMVNKPHDTNSTETMHEDTCPGKSDNATNSDQEGAFDWDEKVQGEILASYFYGYVATQLLGGLISDRFGAHYVCGLGLLFAGILSAASPAAARLHSSAFMVMRILQGACSGTIVPAANVLFSKWFIIKERQRVIGMVLSGNYAGTLVSMGLSGVLIDAWDWTSVFYVYGGICIIFCFLWFYVVYDSPQDHPRISENEKKYIISSLCDHSENEQDRQKHVPVPWFSILTSVPLWATVIMHTGTTWVNYTFMTELPTYTKNVLHFNIKQTGFISALPYVFAGISCSFFGSLSSWLQAQGYLSRLTAYRTFNGIGCLGPAVSLVLITQLGCNSTAIVILLILTITLKCAFYGGSVTNNLDLAPRFAGTTGGIIFTFANMTGIVSPLITGIIINRKQTLTNWHTVFYIAIAVTIIPYMLFLIFASTKEQPWNNPPMKKEEEKQVDEAT